MKICYKCKESEALPYARICRKCKQAYDILYWKEKKSDASKQKKLSYKREIRRRNSQFVYDFLLQNPCVECKEGNPILLEFDHLDRKAKRAQVSDLVKRCCSIETIKEEITKCRVLCVKCHRLHTVEQMGWFRHVVKTYAG